jgi:hypothetical protein
VVAIKLGQLWVGNASPLVEEAPINFPSNSPSETQQFLEDDFELIKKVEALSPPGIGGIYRTRRLATVEGQPGKEVRGH